MQTFDHIAGRLLEHELTVLFWQCRMGRLFLRGSRFVKSQFGTATPKKQMPRTALPKRHCWFMLK